jgi:hypothetical protein
VELNNQPFPEPKGSTHAYVDHENDLIFPISGTSTLLGFSFFREHKRRKKKKKKKSACASSFVRLPSVKKPIELFNKTWKQTFVMFSICYLQPDRPGIWLCHCKLV